MRRLLVALLAALVPVGFTALASPVEVSATSLGPLSCTRTTSPDHVQYWFCTGFMTSFDGVPLDTDVSFPVDVNIEAVRHPLLVMMHGWGGDKGYFESSTISNSNPETSNYNNVSFVSRGYAVLNYTARGHHKSCGPQTPAANAPACARGWTHLADQRYEIRDTQTLASQLVELGIADPNHIGVTGLSYGGGQSWELAIDASKVFGSEGLMNWTYGEGAPMHLAVAVPHYTWTDLANSLIPNGRAADGVFLNDRSRTSPVGIEKQSYVTGLFGEGAASIYYCGETTGGVCPDPSANLLAWFAEINKGEPYVLSDPILAQAYDQIVHFKSPYYRDDLIAADAAHDTAAQYEVPILAEQGWTDALFPESEAVSMVNKLKAADPHWPVSVALSDIGHPDGQNKAGDWAWLNARGNDFIDHYMLGTSFANAANQNELAQAQVSNCQPGSGGAVYSAPSFGQLHTGTLNFSSGDQRSTNSITGDPTVDLQTDPIFTYAFNNQHSTCIVLKPGQSLPGAQAWTFPVTSSFTLLGNPVLHLNTTIQGVNAEIDSRLYDVAPDGTRTLVTRGMWRYDQTNGDPNAFDTQLLGNSWFFPCGHSLQLEVTQDDALYLRKDNLPSSVTYNSMSLTLPTVGSSGACATSGVLAQTVGLPFTSGPAGPLPVVPFALAVLGILTGAAAHIAYRRRAA